MIQSMIMSVTTSGMQQYRQAKVRNQGQTLRSYNQSLPTKYTDLACVCAIVGSVFITRQALPTLPGASHAQLAQPSTKQNITSPV